MRSEQEQFIYQTAIEAKDWLSNHALPTWFDFGLDRNHGGFYEYLTQADLRCHADFKRVRVLARQIYAFSTAYRMGHSTCRFAVEHGLAFLFDKVLKQSGKYPNRLNLRGDTVDDTLDLYDLSFCLFALAHAYNVIPDTRIHDEAIILTHFLHEQFRHPKGGFIESQPATYPRRQNPHMHFFEAALQWRINTGAPLFCELTDELASLFFEKFYNHSTGALLEYFDDFLIPLKAPEQRLTEPGHHFEWMWLLDCYARASSNELPSFKKLYEFAIDYGFDSEENLLLGEVFDDGSQKRDSVRLWPHTEWIKAEVALTRYQESNRLGLAWSALKRFLDCPRKGLWYERYNFANRTFMDEPAPASSFYHIVLAIETLDKRVKELEVG